jgi:transcriptional regulator with XRE-family HTH domain
MSATLPTPPTKAAIKEFLSMLKTLQKDLELTASELAEYIGVNRSTITRWMNKTTLPTADMIHNTLTGLRLYARDLYDEADCVYNALPPETI